MLVSVVVILGIGFEVSVKFRNDVWKIKLIDKIKWWDVLFVMLRSIVNGWGRGRWKGDLFDEGHGRLRFLV